MAKRQQALDAWLHHGRAMPGSRKGRERLFFSCHDPKRDTVTRAIRTQRYKFIQHLVTGERQLFDLSKDPCEFEDLIDEPAAQTIRAELRRELFQ